MTEYPVSRLPGEPACIAIFTVELYAPAAKIWWQANCLPPVMVANARGKPTSWLLDLWPCWARGFGELFLASVGFAKGVPRHRNAARPWNRWSLEHCLSALAVVWLFVGKARLARLFEYRSKIRHHFRAFLDILVWGVCRQVHNWPGHLARNPTVATLSWRHPLRWCTCLEVAGWNWWHRNTIWHRGTGDAVVDLGPTWQAAQRGLRGGGRIGSAGRLVVDVSVDRYSSAHSGIALTLLSLSVSVFRRQLCRVSSSPSVWGTYSMAASRPRPWPLHSGGK